MAERRAAISAVVDELQHNAVHPWQIAEPCRTDRRQDGPARHCRGCGDDQVVSAAPGADAVDVGQQPSVRLCNREIIRLNGYDVEHTGDEFRSLGSVSLVSQLDPCIQFGSGDGGDSHVVVGVDHRPKGRLGAFGIDEDTGIEDQSSGHASVSESTDSRTASTSAANPSSTFGTLSKASTSAPFPLVAGPIFAILRPPRVTITVWPCSTSSRRAAKDRLASVAVTVLTESDYLISCRTSSACAASTTRHTPQNTSSSKRSRLSVADFLAAGSASFGVGMPWRHCARQASNT